MQIEEGDQGASKSSSAPPPFSPFVTEKEEEAAAALDFYGLSFSQLLSEDPPPMPQEVTAPLRPWAAADLCGEGMLDFGRRQYMSSPPHPQLPTMMHAPTMLRTFLHEAKPDSCAYLQPAYQSSLPQQILNPFLQPTPRIAGAPSPNYKLLFHESGGAFEPAIDPYSDKTTSQMSSLAVEKPPGDGYNWRKYGQKQVKGGEFPRSYYKCTTAKCDVKKQVERSFDGNIKEIIYKGEHNHQPSQNRRGGEGGYDDNDTESKFENSSVSNDDDEDGIAINEGNRDTESVESTSQRTVTTTPRVVLQTISETDRLDDGYKWRKYGHKHVKGNNHPRSYYKCTNAGCNVRKKVERSKKDPKAVLTTYEDKHNHDVPKARSATHNTVSAEPASDN